MGAPRRAGRSPLPTGPAGGQELRARRGTALGREAALGPAPPVFARLGRRGRARSRTPGRLWHREQSPGRVPHTPGTCSAAGAAGWA